MKIIKRNGAEVVFDIEKIMMAVTKANEAVDEKVRMTPLQIQRISQSVAIACEEIFVHESFHSACPYSVA